MFAQYTRSVLFAQAMDGWQELIPPGWSLDRPGLRYTLQIMTGL